MQPPSWLAFAVAPFIGSLLGVLVRRLPDHRPVGLARSACDSCGHTLGPAELVPLISYAWLRGRCRWCGAPIGRFHPAIELAALAVPACLLLAGLTAPAWLWGGCVLGWGLLALAWTDAERFLLPDALTLPLLLAGLLWCWIAQPEALGNHAAACAVGYLSLRAVGFTYRRLRGRNGLGQGDAKLFALAGAWCGLQALPDVLLAGALLGLGLAGALALRGRTMTLATRLPFGAPLALGVWAIWLAQGSDWIL